MTFVIRQAEPAHARDLLEIARTVNFINLPPFADAIGSRIGDSERSFAETLSADGPPAGDVRSDRRYMFVLEGLANDEAADPDGASSRRVIGTSGITAGMGNERDPNLSYQLLRVRRRSEDLAKQDPDLEETGLDYVTGEVEHIVAQLYRDRSSPTELGALVVRKEHRGRRHGAKELPGQPTPGRVLSLVRFHFLKRFMPWFSNVLLAEMMAPLESYNDGNPFWRHFVRRFINIPYDKADRLSTRKREFMYRLLPDRVYMSLLHDDVVSHLGAVGEATKPARRMLEELGFRYTHRIDPFDAGPHLEAPLAEVSAVRETMKSVVSSVAPVGELSGGSACVLSADGERSRFLAAAGALLEDRGAGGDEVGKVVIDEASAAALGVGPGDEVWRTPLLPTAEEHEDYPIPVIDLPALDDPGYDEELAHRYARHAVGEPGRQPGPAVEGL